MANSKVSIQPWLTIADGNKAVEFYQSAFAATETYRMEPGPGQLVARLTIGDASFWISGDDTSESPSQNARFLVVVPDPESYLERAVAAGAKEIFPVREEYGWKSGKVEDPFGYEWEFGFELESE